jgi:hypothetical protein
MLYALFIVLYSDPTVTLNSGTAQNATASSLFKLTIPAGTSTVFVSFPAVTRVQRRFNGAASIYRGPLLFALVRKIKNQILFIILLHCMIPCNIHISLICLFVEYSF